MSHELEFSLVDAFTGDRFGGNRAGVVLGARVLSDEQMQSIAAEVYAPETSFVLPPTVDGARLRIRWFTPAMEVAMCGHATIAAIHALVRSGELAGLLDSTEAVISIETKGGMLRARCERLPGEEGRFLVWLDLVNPTLTPKQIDRSELGKLLGVPLDMFEAELPIMLTQDEDLIVFVRNQVTLNGARPDFRALKEYGERESIRGVLVSTLNAVSASIQCQSRFFAPAAGIDEDPVTGSVHGPLGVYLVANQLAPMHGQVAALSCLQGIPGQRTGLVRVMVTRHPGRGYSVRIAGECVTTIQGKAVV